MRLCSVRVSSAHRYQRLTRGASEAAPAPDAEFIKLRRSYGPKHTMERNDLQQSHPAPIAIWRRPAKSGVRTPLVVFLHGRGADEHDLISLAGQLPRSFAYVSLRGPVALEDGGYTWFENRGPGRPIAKSLRASVAALRAWLDDPAASESRSPAYVLGFSAGMMMAGALVLDDPQRFAGAILLSGVLPLESGLPVEPGRLIGLPVFRARGTLDTVLPADLVAQTDAYLTARSGATLTVRTYNHGHSISSREIDDIAAWLNERA